MTLLVRVIPLLHIKSNSLVKGVQLEGLRSLGSPDVYAKWYYEQCADEIAYLDIVASLYQRNSLGDVLAKTTDQVFVPVAAGGGIRSVDDARRLLNFGADKILINTAAIRRPQLIQEIAYIVGCQSVVLYIEAKKRGGWYECLTDSARECAGRNVVDWVQEAVSLGCGEVLLASVDRDGTGLGYDLPLIHAVASVCTVPLIAAGGCGTPQHAVEAVQAGADAVAVSSYLHYGAMAHVASINKQQEGNREFLRGTRGVSKFAGTIQDIKHALAQAGHPVRAADQALTVA